jgi:hypothetical protein
MGVAASLPVSVFLGVTPANATVTVPVYEDTGIAQRVILPTFRETEQPVQRMRYFVRMEPRRFGDAAKHLVRITRPIEWPVDEPDVE